MILHRMLSLRYYRYVNAINEFCIKKPRRIQIQKKPLRADPLKCDIIELGYKERGSSENGVYISDQSIGSNTFENIICHRQKYNVIRYKSRSFHSTSILCSMMGDQANNVDLGKCFEVINNLVTEAGRLIARNNETRKDFVCKSGDIDLVTQTDQDVEKLLMDGIRQQFPDHKFIGEEESSSNAGVNKLTDDPTWIIDPVDGTMNFVHAFPHSCISVGLKVNKITEIGIVYNPMLEQRFTARRGQGAYYNGRRIQVSGQKEIGKALVTSEFGTTRDEEKLNVVIENFTKMAKKVHGVRCLGSAALNMVMVAMGAADANYEFGIHAWDVCAGDLIVREAGGVVIDPSGGSFDIMSRRVLAAATPELGLDIAKVLTQYQPLPRDD